MVNSIGKDGMVKSQNTSNNNTSSVDVPTDHEEVLNFIHTSYSLKPRNLMMSELKWKYLVRSGVRGKNIMMTGPALVVVKLWLPNRWLIL